MKTVEQKIAEAGAEERAAAEKLGVTFPPGPDAGDPPADQAGPQTPPAADAPPAESASVSEPAPAKAPTDDTPAKKKQTPGRTTKGKEKDSETPPAPDKQTQAAPDKPPEDETPAKAPPESKDQQRIRELEAETTLLAKDNEFHRSNFNRVANENIRLELHQRILTAGNLVPAYAAPVEPTLPTVSVPANPPVSPAVPVQTAPAALPAPSNGDGSLQENKIQEVLAWLTAEYGEEHANRMADLIRMQSEKSAITAAREAAQSTAAEINQRYEPLMQSVQMDIRQQAHDVEEARGHESLKVITAVHPDVLEISESEDFRNWVAVHPQGNIMGAGLWPKDPDPQTGFPGETGYSPEGVIDVLNAYKADHPALQARVERENEARLRSESAAVNDVGQVETAPTLLESDGPVMRLSEFMRLAEEVKQSPEKLTALNAELDAAMTAGTFIDDTRYQRPIGS